MGSKALIWLCCKCGKRGRRTSGEEITVENNNEDDGERPVMGEESRNENVSRRPRSLFRYFDCSFTGTGFLFPSEKSSLGSCLLVTLGNDLDNINQDNSFLSFILIQK